MRESVGLPIIDYYTIGYSFYLEGDETKNDRKRIVASLKSLEKDCIAEMTKGAKVLRLPLSKTTYKTRRYYHELDPDPIYISLKEPTASGQKNSIVLKCGKNERAIISPRSKKLYSDALQFVDKRISRAYIERSFGEEDGVLVIVAYIEVC